MKKSIVWAAMCVVFMGTFSSCDKGEDPIPAIVGTWVLNTYQIKDTPPNFTAYENFETDALAGVESGYTFVFKADGTYTRSFKLCCNIKSVNDQGTYTLEGSTVIVKPDDNDDLDLIDDYMNAGLAIGLEFNVESEPDETRMKLSTPGVVLLLPNDWPQGETPSDEDWVPVDVKLIYVFDKLN